MVQASGASLWGFPPNPSLSPCLCPGSPPGEGQSGWETPGGVGFGALGLWASVGSSLQGLATAFPVGRQRGGLCKTVSLWSHPIWEATLPLPGSSIPPCPWGSESFAWVPGGCSGGAELSINLISASCSPHPQAAVSHPENGSQARLGQAESRQTAGGT